MSESADSADAQADPQTSADAQNSADVVGPLHFIGIGGAGMSVVAELLLAQGIAVQGSDAQASLVLDRLRSLGAQVWDHHDGANVGSARQVVISTAIRPDNPELILARAQGIDVIHRSQALALAARGKRFVAVAGAHGKTTTSAMLAVGLGELGWDPGFAVGSNLVGVGSGAHRGSGDVFVAEADESDGSFLNYDPTVALVMNVEPDHLDHYGSESALVAAFDQFAARVSGTLVACADDPGSAALAQRSRAGGRTVVTYGRGEADVRILDQEQVGDGLRARLVANDALGGVSALLTLAVPGEHYLLNAAGAWSAGIALGAEPQAMADALGAFRGTDRRFQPRGESHGVRVIDDYAHHPTEVAAVLTMARTVAGEGKVHVIFQPHLYSRTVTFADQFATALSKADTVILTEIYRARENYRTDVTSEIVTDQIDGARYVPQMADAAREIAAAAAPGDLVLTLGAGDITTLAPAIVAALDLHLGSP